MRLLKKPLVIGIACALIAFLWQALTVRYNFRGEWSALYYTGGLTLKAPVALAENTYVFPNSYGWDGQWYHAMAHDPLLERGTGAFIDAPRLRYRRILFSAVAHLIAFGHDAWVDLAYRLAILGSFVLGGWCLALFSQLCGRHPAWGILYVLVPGSIASMDRMAVDGGLVVAAIAFALFTLRGNQAALYPMLVFAALVRETGLLFTVAYCLWLLRERRDWRKAILFGTAVLPALAWYAFIATRTPPHFADGTTALAWPFTGVVHRYLHPMEYPFPLAAVLLVRAGDFLAVTGAVAAMLLAFRRFRIRGMRPVDFAVILFALLGIFIWRPGDWLETLDYGRILSPLLVLLALESLEDRQLDWRKILLYAGPAALILQRFLIGMGSQGLGILRGIWSS